MPVYDYVWLFRLYRSDGPLTLTHHYRWGIPWPGRHGITRYARPIRLLTQLLNQLLNHQMVFTNIENITNIDKVSKYIEVEKSDEIFLQNFIHELKLLNIYDQLETKLHTNPETNYEIFTMLLKFVKDKHIPKKTVKYKKHLHMKSKWMTNGHLRINRIHYIKHVYMVSH